MHLIRYFKVRPFPKWSLCSTSGTNSVECSSILVPTFVFVFLNFLWINWIDRPSDHWYLIYSLHLSMNVYMSSTPSPSQIIYIYSIGLSDDLLKAFQKQETTQVSWLLDHMYMWRSSLALFPTTSYHYHII